MEVSKMKGINNGRCLSLLVLVSFFLPHPLSFQDFRFMRIKDKNR